ncbi:MAG: Holliday junction branch migration protein RuvA [Candidatus Lindowbacteria bacterium]|nr:Holliday junction branch migration protein RuvA [Candidatus Lindowbacteria bacterium]
MIRRLAGTLIEKNLRKAIVSCGGIGFSVAVSRNLVLPDEGENVVLWTHLRMRDDGADLYGFESKEDLSLFEKMLKIHGVSAKKAMSVVSHFGCDGLKSAIAAGEYKTFTAVPGIGKKIAQQLLLDMKGVLDLSDDVLSTDNKNLDDGTLALMELGFKESEALERIKRVRAASPDVTDTAEIVKLALQEH